MGQSDDYLARDHDAHHVFLVSASQKSSNRFFTACHSFSTDTEDRFNGVTSHTA